MKLALILHRGDIYHDYLYARTTITANVGVDRQQNAYSFK
jgi:hypothetical protein